MLPAYLLCAAVLLVLGLLLLGWTRGRSGVSVVLLGACDSGKTTLFLRVQDSGRATDQHRTVASLQENRDTVDVTATDPRTKRSVTRTVTLTEVPGHRRLRGRVKGHVQRAARVVFLVDSVNFMASKSETADVLFEVLAAASSARGSRPAILVACNKADQGAQAHTVEFIRKRLEKEVQVLRSTESARLGAEDSSAGARVAVPSRTEPFSFEGYSSAGGSRVTFAATSALSGDLAEVKGFMVL